MGVLDGALMSFLNAMKVSPTGRKVTVAVYSEFGRRVAAKALPPGGGVLRLVRMTHPNGGCALYSH